jgi:glycosyltransferase involved in cell wall biosynthesis
VIANGIETDVFRPEPQQGRAFREELGVGYDAPLIGMVGRLDPMKGHGTFLEAAALLARELADCRVVCVGGGPAAFRTELQRRAERLGIADKVILTGPRADLVAVYSALDVAAVPSGYGEGFSNVVGEAMACGTPCVVTDVGDNSAIVGSLGRVVPPNNPAALAEGIMEILAHPAGFDPDSLRSRIGREFSATELIEETECLLHARSSEAK